MRLNNLNIGNASDALGISKRQFSRILSGESKAKRLHALAMQMVWLINENKKKIIDENQNKTLQKKNYKDSNTLNKLVFKEKKIHSFIFISYFFYDI